MSETLRDKLRGMLLGLAVGDALGACVEFQSRDNFPPVTGYRAGGPHPIPVGGWTDDTSMALALADSLKRAGFNLDDQLSAYCDWARQGKYSVIGRLFDIGIQTRTALDYWETGRGLGHRDLNREDHSGNGSLMRLAPVVIYCASLANHFFHMDQLGDLCALSSYTTHPNQRCQDACRLLGWLLADLAAGETKEQVLSETGFTYARVWNRIQDQVIRDLWLKRGWEKKERHQIRSGGYVADTLEAALWCFARTDNFRDCVLLAANLGEDADTTGAVAGQLAGAYYGEAGIPPDLLDGLARCDMLEAALEGLC